MAVHVERRDHIGVITLDRPEARNAIDADTTTQLVAAVDEMEADPEIRVVILTGAGSFSAGADLNVVASGQLDRISTPDGGFAGFAYRLRRKPFIAAVEGWAMGGGCEMALACDVIVAARTAKFGLPEVKIGVVAGAGGLTRLATSVGSSRARLMLLTGSPISGEQAYDFGLAAVLADGGEALTAALEVAGQIAGNSPSAVRLSREVARIASGVEADAVTAAQDRARAIASGSPDGREGVAAFLEKRSPVWHPDTMPGIESE